MPYASPSRSISASPSPRSSPAAIRMSTSLTASRPKRDRTYGRSTPSGRMGTSWANGPSAEIPSMRTAEVSLESRIGTRHGAPAWRSGTRRAASATAAPVRASTRDNPVTTGASVRARSLATRGSVSSPRPHTISMPLPARAAGPSKDRFTAEPTPTVWTRAPCTFWRKIAVTISCSNPMSPSVTRTTWAARPGRTSERARSMPSRISVPPEATSDASHADAARFVSGVANAGPCRNARGRDENSTRWTVSFSSRDATSANATRFAWASGSPPIDPLVSSNTVKSLGTARTWRPAGATTVTSAYTASSSRSTCTCAAPELSARAPSHRTTTSRSSGMCPSPPNVRTVAAPSFTHWMGCEGDSGARPASRASRTTSDNVTRGPRGMCSRTSNVTFDASTTRPDSPRYRGASVVGNRASQTPRLGPCA